jgi:hypothetical protein
MGRERPKKRGQRKRAIAGVIRSTGRAAALGLGPSEEGRGTVIKEGKGQSKELARIASPCYVVSVRAEMTEPMKTKGSL